MPENVYDFTLTFDSTFTVEGTYDGVKYFFQGTEKGFSRMDFIDSKNRNRFPDQKQLDQLLEIFKDTIANPVQESMEPMEGLLEEILGDGFKFDDNAEIMFGS